MAATRTGVDLKAGPVLVLSSNLALPCESRRAAAVARDTRAAVTDVPGRGVLNPGSWPPIETTTSAAGTGGWCAALVPCRACHDPRATTGGRELGGRATRTFSLGRVSFPMMRTTIDATVDADGDAHRRNPESRQPGHATTPAWPTGGGRRARLFLAGVGPTVGLDGDGRVRPTVRRPRLYEHGTTPAAATGEKRSRGRQQTLRPPERVRRATARGPPTGRVGGPPSRRGAPPPAPCCPDRSHQDVHGASGCDPPTSPRRPRIRRPSRE